VCDRQLAYSVPAQHVFVMNDQRAYDSDSRTWGPVELDQIEGRVQLVWWSH
jgi:signal peptidase I